MLWYSYCFPDWTCQKLPSSSFKCWKAMLSITISSAFLSTYVLHTRVQLKGEGHKNNRNSTDTENKRRSSICPQEWAVRFMFLCRRLIFFMSFGPHFFKPSSHLLWVVAVALTAAWAASRGKLWAQFTCLSQPCHMLILPHWGFFWRQRTTQHQTLRTFFLKENINSWTPPRDLDKLQSG